MKGKVSDFTGKCTASAHLTYWHTKTPHYWSTYVGIRVRGDFSHKGPIQYNNIWRDFSILDPFTTRNLLKQLRIKNWHRWLKFHDQTNFKWLGWESSLTASFDFHSILFVLLWWRENYFSNSYEDSSNQNVDIEMWWVSNMESEHYSQLKNIMTLSNLET